MVDDNQTNRHILTDTLLGWRMRPHPVAGAHDALDRMRNACEDGAPFPVVLTDAHMPDMDGFQLAEQVRRSPHLAGAVILMLSSGERHGDAQRCRDLGVAACLTKPVRRADLHRAIVRALNDQLRTDRSVPVSSR